jgi:hypothetical protein
MRIPRRRRSDKHDTGESCRRFGTVAVNRKFATIEQVRSAILEQLEDDVNGREHRLLGSILYDKGWISEEQIEAILKEIRKNGD